MRPGARALDGGRSASPAARASGRRPRDAIVAGEAGAVIWRTGQVFAEPSDARHAAATAHPHRGHPLGPAPRRPPGGSLENRVRVQDSYECHILIANLHAFTTRADKPDAIGSEPAPRRPRDAMGKGPSGSGPSPPVCPTQWPVGATSNRTSRAVAPSGSRRSQCRQRHMTPRSN